MTKTIFATDLHGNQHAYDELFSLATKENLDIILGGDLTPKLIAIKLKDYLPEGIDESDYDEENMPDKTPGEIIPTEMIGEDENKTYTPSLESVKRLNKRFSSKELEKELKKTGYIIHKCESAFYRLKDMLDDSIMLDRLNSFFKTNTRNEQLLEFTDYEKESLSDLIQTIKEIEENWSNDKRKGLEKEWNRFFEGFSNHSFWRLDISNTLFNYINLKNKSEQAEKEYKKLSDTLKDCSDPDIKKHYKIALSRALEDIELAKKMMGIYSYEHYLESIANQLTTNMPVKQLTDLATKPDTYIQGQKEFVNQYLKEKLIEFKKQNPDSKVFTILGNDDMTEVEQDIQELHEQGLITYLNNNAVQLESNLFIAGYPFVRSTKGMFYPGWEKTEDEIEKDLESLASQTDPKKTIYVMHSPAFNTGLDLAYNNEHIGSKAVRQFIEKNQPYLTLHGHVHESPEKSRRFKENMGQTVSINPGSSESCKEGQIRAIIFDPENLKSVKLRGYI